MTYKTIFTIILSFTLGVPYIGKAMETENTKTSPKYTAESIALYKIEAEKGEEKSQVLLAGMYEEGLGGLPKDETKALFWYEEAARQGNALASCRIACVYEKGLGEIPKDVTKALFWYEEAARQGNAAASCRIACVYEKGLGEIPKDEKKALYWFQKAANQGHSQAQSFLGGMYKSGLGTLQDYQQAFFWLQKAAEQNNAFAHANLAGMYLEGLGISQDYQQAFFWAHKGSEQGEPSAQTFLATMYLNGYGTLPDYDQAFLWFQKAAEQGHPHAQYNLGGMYKRGFGVPQDYEKAFLWFQKAAEQNETESFGALAQMYRRGLGIPQDYQQAICWYLKGAEQGDSSAQTGLASMYLNGDGISIDYQKSLFWFQKAADQGNPAAQTGLASMYFNGFGTPKDHKKSLFWFQKAADQGDVKALQGLEILKLSSLPQPPKLGGKEKALIGLKKAHHDKKNNHKDHYKTLLQLEKEGEVIAKKHLDSVRNSHPQKQAGRETKRLLKEVEEEVSNPTTTASVAEAPLVVNAPTAPPFPPSSKDKDKEKNKGSHFMKRGKKIFKQAKRVSMQNQSDGPSETKAEPVIETSPKFTTPPTLAALEPIHLIPFSPIEPPVERFIPPQSNGEKIKTKGKGSKKKKKENEEKSKWRLFGQKMKDKNPANQNGISPENKESTQIALYTHDNVAQNQSIQLRKTIKKILRTSKQMLDLDENTIVKTLSGLHKAGEINLRNVVPTEAGTFTVTDNKIVATKVHDPFTSLTIHTHGTWWKKPGIIKDFLCFLQALPEEGKREFQDALYNIKKDKK